MGRRTAGFAGAFALLVSGCVGEIASNDHVDHAAQLARKLAPMAPAPAWETVYPFEHADIVQFVDAERLLIGAVATGATFGVPEFKGVMLVDARNGGKLWEAERRHLKDGKYTVLALEPRIVLLGMNPERLALTALEPASGARAWSAELSSPRATALSADGRRLFAARSRAISAIDLQTGQTAWTRELGAEQLGKDGRILLHAEGDAVYVAGTGLVRLAADTGNVLWAAQSPELASADMQMVTAEGGMLVWSGRSLAFLDGRDGRVRWRRAAERGLIKAVMPHPQRIVQILTIDPAEPTVGDGVDNMRALDPASGAVAWTRSLGGTVIGQTLVDDLLAVSLEDELVGVDTASGAVRFRRNLPDVLRLANPLDYDPPGQPDVLRAAGGMLYLARESGGIVGYSLPQGTEAWRHSTLVAQATAYPYSTPTRLDRLRATLAMHKAPPPAMRSTSALAFQSQPYPMRQSLERDYARLESNRRQAASRNDRAEARSIGQRQTHNLNQQITALNMEQSARRSSAQLALASSILDFSVAMSDAFMATAIEGMVSRMSMEINHTADLHQGAFRGRYYVRPFQVTGAEGAQGVSLIDLETGQRTEVMTSPYLSVTTGYGIEAPHYVLDPSGDRMVTIGIGLRPERWQAYVSRTQRQPRPSLIAYDVGSLKFAPQNQIVEKNLSGARPGSPEVQFVAAAQTGNLAKVQRMLAAGTAVDARNPRGMTALAAAAEKNKPGVAQLLLHKGADVNARAADGKTALDYAADPSMQKLLRAAGGRKAADLRK